MFILRCDQNRNLEFIKKERIIQGEHCFDSIKVELPENIGEYPISDLSIKMKFVSGSGYIDRQVIAKDGAIYTDIDYTLTETAKRWLFYLTFYYNNDEDVEIGKTNSIAIQINKIPYSEKLEVKNKEPEIIMVKGDKGEPGPMGPIGPQGPPGVTSYADLTDKPSVNGATLSGNKTTSELGLQKKLTAGTNITITNDGTISASGGITNYDDLTNKPKIRVPVYEYDIYIDDEDVIIDNTISLIGSGLAYTNSYGDPHLFLKNVSTASLNDNENFLVGKNLYSQEKYDFNTLSYSFRRAGMWEATALVCTHAPSFITNSFVSGRDNYNFLIIHYFAHAHIGGGAPIVRCIVGKDINNDFRIFYQYIRLSNNNDGAIISQSNWVELTNGSQIVSGIVNQNGTITFTDSDGNTFTTTGSSVIGADGFSPTATVTQTASGATVSITDKNGTTTANISNGADGQDYVLTSQDKTDIANIVLQLLPTTQGVLYGNASN